MDVSVLTMPKEAALEKFEEYKAAVKRSRNAQDRMMMKAFEALKDGRGVLNIKEALSKGGVHSDTWLPKLAAMRADEKLVYFRRGDGGGGTFAGSVVYSPRFGIRRTKGAQAARLQFALPRKSLPEHQGQWPEGYWDTHSAPLPSIPPALRPADALSKYVTLWEVDVWSPVAPPTDPILLKPIAGDLYAVVAAWDLTECERMVLGAILGA